MGPNGTIQKIGWKTIDGNKYYFDLTTGAAYANGIYEINNKLYYFKSSAIMEANQLVEIDGNYYYFNVDGTMKKNGWKDIDGNKYYFSATGAAYTNEMYEISNQTYYFNNQGIMIIAQLVKIDENYYYFNTNGTMQKNGWKTIDGDKYYFGPTGAAYTNGIYEINNQSYYFNNEGIMVTNQIIITNGNYYHFGTTGIMTKGWKTISGNTYYFDPNTGIATTGTVEIDSITYIFSDDGVLLETIVPVDYESFYQKSSSYLYVQLRDSLDGISNRQDLMNAIYTSMNWGVNARYDFNCIQSYACLLEFQDLIETDELYNVQNYLSPFNWMIPFNLGMYQGIDYCFYVIWGESIYTEEQQQQIIAVILEVEEELYNENDTDLQKLEKVYNWMITHVEYDYDLIDDDPDNDNRDGFRATGALLNGIAVCEGYAEAMSLFLNHIGIDNYIVMSDTHAWNAVYINDTWYHIDATWDDGGNYNREMFFLVTTEELLDLDSSGAHIFDTTVFQEFAPLSI